MVQGNKELKYLWDLIKKMLVKNPLKRLGGGLNGTKYDIHHLKKHKFFAAKTYNFDNVYKHYPQIQKWSKGIELTKFWKRYDKLEFSEYQKKGASGKSDIKREINKYDSDSD